MVVAGGSEDGWVFGVPGYAVDAADVGVEGFDEEAVGAPDVYARVCEDVLALIDTVCWEGGG